MGHCCSVAKSCPTLQCRGLQHTKIARPSPSPGVRSNSCALSQWCHPTISSSVTPYSGFQSLPVSGSFPMSWLFTSGSQNIGASASASIPPMNSIPMNDFLYDWLVWSSYCPRVSQESSAPQFKSINSSVLSLLYGPALTSLHDYWKNHSLNYTDLCRQSDVSAF